MGEELREEFVLLLFLGGGWERGAVKFTEHVVSQMGEEQTLPALIQGLETFLIFDNRVHCYYHLQNNVPIALGQ